MWFNHKKEKHKLAVIFFARAIFIVLIIFEILNYLKILEFNLEYTWLGLVITSIATLVILEITASKYKKLKGEYLHWSVWLIVAVSLSLDAGGDFFHWYGIYWWWDRIVHFFVSAVICFTIFTVASAFWIDKFKFSLLLKTGRFKLALFLASTTTITLSVFYEIEEYVEDLFFHTHRMGPGADTSDDLLFNTLGVILIIIVLSIYYKITKKREVFE